MTDARRPPLSRDRDQGRLALAGTGLSLGSTTNNNNGEEKANYIGVSMDSANKDIPCGGLLVDRARAERVEPQATIVAASRPSHAETGQATQKKGRVNNTVPARNASKKRACFSYHPNPRLFGPAAGGFRSTACGRTAPAMFCFGSACCSPGKPRVRQTASTELTLERDENNKKLKPPELSNANRQIAARQVVGALGASNPLLARTALPGKNRLAWCVRRLRRDASGVATDHHRLAQQT